MGFFDRFRSKAPIGPRKALEGFVERRTAALAPKGIYEHSRARAETYSKMLLIGPAFIEAANRACRSACADRATGHFELTGRRRRRSKGSQ